jgi:dienelactone hydrolase
VKHPPLRLDRRDFLRIALASTCAAAGASPLVAQETSSAVVLPINERLRAFEAAAPLAMQFRGTTADDARRWQAEFAAKLRERLGSHQPPAQYECLVERRVELPTHVREECVLTADAVAPLPFHLLLPRREASAPSARRPGILAIHGHGDFGHDSIAGIDDAPERRAEIDKFKYDYGLKLVERGYVVAAPCLTPFGRRLGTDTIKRGDACTLVHLQLQHLGKLLIAENLRDCLWTLDFLANHAVVDAGRLGCVGLSYGGRMTTLTAALDPRIRVAVIGGAMNTFQERALIGSTSGCQVIPGLLNYGDMPEVGGLIAPRPCVWTVGETDRLLDPAWVELFRERLARVYAALGSADQLYIDRFAGGHVWHGDLAYPILEQALHA